MNDTRFDGLKVYRSQEDGMAVFEIKGKFIYARHSGGRPTYEVRGDSIFIANTVTLLAVYDIRENNLYQHMTTSNPLRSSPGSAGRA
jgi:hypothetical protein